MINDLPSVVRSARCLLFADDLKLFLGVENQSDCAVLQGDIDRVVKWSEHNHLEFNASKCKSITFTRSRSPIIYNYNINNVPLERVTHIRDLGLTLDAELTFNAHITELCAQSHRTLGFVMRQASRFCERSTIVALYYAFVRSKLEFGAVIFDPHECKYKLMIEKIQKRFCRFLFKNMYGYYPNYTYPSLFVAGMVGINTLELRRKCAIMIHYYLLLNSRIDNPSALASVSLITPERSRRAHVRRLLAAAPTRTQTAHYAPTAQGVNLLNALIAFDPDVDLFNISRAKFLERCIRFLSFNGSPG